MKVSPKDVRSAVRDRYRSVAVESEEERSCCGATDEAASCCGTPSDETSSARCGGGYTIDQIRTLPDGADLGLGCGNPTLIAELSPGETVLDLGSGAGVDVFLAARAVGPGGHVVGVDMTPEMVEKARRNARVGEVENVEFVLGEIEALPLSDDSVDVVISNCVVNLSPEKGRVFAEVFRVLKPGGRLAISDIIAMRPMTEAERADMALYGACVSGAETKESVVDMLRLAGFEGANAEIGDSNVSWKSIDKPNYPVASAIIRGSKPLS